MKFTVTYEHRFESLGSRHQVVVGGNVRSSNDSRILREKLGRCLDYCREHSPSFVLHSGINGGRFCFKEKEEAVLFKMHASVIFDG